MRAQAPTRRSAWPMRAADRGVPLPLLCPRRRSREGARWAAAQCRDLWATVPAAALYRIAARAAWLPAGAAPGRRRSGIPDRDRCGMGCGATLARQNRRTPLAASLSIDALDRRIDTSMNMSRSTRWWLRRIDVVGALPAATAPGLLLTCHWGAGSSMETVSRPRRQRLFRRLGARRPPTSAPAEWLFWYGRLRGWSSPHVGSRGPLYTRRQPRTHRGGVAQGARRGRHARPAGAAPACAPRTCVCSEPLRLPIGLPQLASSSGAAITLFHCGLDFNSGRRTLRIKALPGGLDPTRVYSVGSVLRHHCAKHRRLGTCGTRWAAS